jgi:hypothetical protein
MSFLDDRDPYCAYYCSDRLLHITLWGEHATSFEGESLTETIAKDEPIVMVFAGVQVKQYLGSFYLWYPFHVPLHHTQLLL